MVDYLVKMMSLLMISEKWIDFVNQVTKVHNNKINLL